MLSDSRYENNIILQKEALQGLLTNIKNYPVIDIDYIPEYEVDDKERPIWTSYTEGTPCIKITYGDNNTTKGNIIFADSLRQAINKKIKKRQDYEELRDKQNVIIKYSEEIFKVNDNIYKDRYKALQNYLEAQMGVSDNLSSLLADRIYYFTQHQSDAQYRGLQDIEDIEDFIKNNIQKLLHSNESTMTQYYADKSLIFEPKDIMISFDKKTYALQYKTIYNDQNVPIGKEYIDVNLEENNINEDITSIPATFYIIKNKNVFGTIKSHLNKASSIINKETGQLWYPTPAEQQLLTELQAEMEDYPDYQLLSEGLQPYILVEENAVYSESRVYYKKDKTTQRFAPVDESYDEASFNNDKQNNEVYVYIQAQGTDYLKTIHDFMINLIANVINTAKKKRDLAYELWQEAIRALEETETNIQNTQADIDTYNEYVDKVASGEYRLIPPENSSGEYTIQSNYQQLTTGTEYNNSLHYFQKDENDKFIPYTYNEGTWVADVANGKVYKALIDDLEDRTMYGYKYVKVGSNIQFDKNLENKEYSPSRDVESYKYPEVDPNSAYQRNGHFKITINGHVYEVGIKGLEDSDDEALKINTDVLPTVNGSNDPDAGSNLGDPNARWKDIYGVNLGSELKPFEHGYFNEIKIGDVTIGGEGGTGDGGKFLRGDGQWANGFDGYVVIDTSSGFDPNINYYTKTTENGQNIYTLVTDTTGQPESNTIYYTNKITIAFNNSDEDGTEYEDNPNYILNTSDVYDNSKTYYTDTSGTVYNYNEATWATDQASLYIIDGTVRTYSKSVDAAIYTIGGIAAEKNIWANKVFNAVFNDYAEYRESIGIIKPGCCVREISDNGELGLTQSRLMPGAQIVSDTFGHSMGMTNNAQTPVAVAGRVLAYTYQDRSNYHTGMAVCSAPNGTIDIMTREEMIKYPDAIIGIVSEIPSYDTWGSDNVNVDGRIWIKVR